MTVRNVEFLLVVERGVLEAQACLLVESIRRFAGRYADCPIRAISPRGDWRPGQETISRLQAAGAEYLPLEVESRVPEYGTSYRVHAAAWLARRSGPTMIVQLDTDTVFVGEPAFDLGDALALARPVDEVGMAARGPGCPHEDHWQAMARCCGVDLDTIGWIRTSTCGTRVRASFNGGLVAARRELFIETESCFNAIVEADARSWPDQELAVRAGSGLTSAAGYAWWGTSQAAISMAAARLGGRIDELDPASNIPLHLRSAGSSSTSSRPVHLHYHWLFGSKEEACEVLDSIYDQADPVRNWLAERLPLKVRSIEGAGHFSPQRLALAEAEIGLGEPACSVVMTCYSDTRFLDEAVKSVLAQQFRDFELIVVDDGSPDPGPVASLTQRDPRIRVVRLDRNRGAATAANSGIEIARAPLIARLDADDVAEPGWLASTISALRDDPGLGLVGSAVTLIDEAGHFLKVQEMPGSDLAIRFTSLFHTPFYHSTTVYRRSLFEAVGGYLPEKRLSQDAWLWAAMLPHTSARNLAEPLVRYRINSRGLTASHAASKPRDRTRPIRERLWREIALRGWTDDQILDDASALLRRLPLPAGTRRKAAAALIETALDRVLEIAGDVQRPGDEAADARFEADVRELLSAVVEHPGLFTRTLRSLRRCGAGATTTAALRNLARLLPRHSDRVTAASIR